MTATDPTKKDVPCWVAEARNGSIEALGRLYSDLGGLVYRTAYRLLGSEADAADVTQDVFVGLPEALRRYTEQGRFASWLRVVTVRTCQARMRAARRSQARALRPEEGGGAVDPPSTVDRIAVERALTALPQRLRMVFLLREVEGYSHAEIGEMLDISVGASQVRLHRAWRLLRRRLMP